MMMTAALSAPTAPKPSQAIGKTPAPKARAVSPARAEVTLLGGKPKAKAPAPAKAVASPNGAQLPAFITTPSHAPKPAPAKVVAPWEDPAFMAANAVSPGLAQVGPYRQWSPSAVACYLRQGQCQGCFYQRFFEESQQQCQMAAAVGHLLNKLGEPNSRHLSRVN
jgi:hypothetical protein